MHGVFGFARKLLAHHQMHDPRPVDVGDRAFGDHLAVAHDRHRVANGEDLVEHVADVDDADPARLERADGGVELDDLRGGKPAGRLVHEDHPRIERERLHDLDLLLLDGRQTADRGVEVEIDAVPLEQRERLAPLAPRVDEAEAARRLPAEKDVVEHRHGGREIGVLVDAGDAAADHLLGIAERRRFAGDFDRAVRRRDGAGQDLDQRRLARAVGADQRAHLARHDRQVGVAQRDEIAVDLGEADAADEGRLGHVSRPRQGSRSAGAAASAPAAGRSRRPQAE